jgi:hypothetical protein
MIWIAFLAIISNNAKSDQELKQKVIQLTDSFGTIECDNVLRGLGTKVLLSSRKLEKGSIFVTAAHTLFDNENSRRYKNCFFKLGNSRFNKRPFDRTSNTYYSPLDNEFDKAANDYIFFYIKNSVSSPGIRLKETGKSEVNLISIGFDSFSDKIILNNPCERIRSEILKLDGILIHNCDSKAGNSGGAIIDRETGSLVAIHGGKFLINENKENTNFLTKTITINHGKEVDLAFVKSLDNFILSLIGDQ